MKIYGAWLSLARALGLGPRGRQFKSVRPDHISRSTVTAQLIHSGRYPAGGNEEYSGTNLSAPTTRRIENEKIRNDSCADFIFYG